MGLFDKHDGNSSNHTCPAGSLYETKTDPIVGTWSFHQLNVVISGAAIAFSCLSIIVLMSNHATHLSKPKEQLNIMRICLSIPIYGILCFISLVFPVTYVYLHPWTDLAQAMALGNFFLLLCQLVSPNDDERDDFFAALKVPHETSKRGGTSSPHTQDGLTWYRSNWIGVFQFVPVSLLVGVFTCITQAARVYCLTSSKPYFAHLWLNIIHSISLAYAVISVLKFYKALKTELSGHKALAKLLAFKLLVGLNFLLNIIFLILDGIDPSPLAPTGKMSYSDMTVGVPMLVNCLLMVPFSIFFHYAYDVKPYHLPDLSHLDSETEPMRGGPLRFSKYQGGPLGMKAWFWVWNLKELISAICFSFTMGSESKKMGVNNSPNFYERNMNLNDWGCDTSFESRTGGYGAAYANAGQYGRP